MAIGIFGGTFNPPHPGHLRLLEAFVRQFRLDRVLVIPTFVPPHKAAPDLASAEDRLEMCRLMFTGKEYTVSDMEIVRGGKSYTVETLETLQKEYPAEPLFLLMGSDMLQSFDSWYRADDIRRMCTLCAAPRDNETTLDGTAAALLTDFDPIVLSSTEVRRRILEGEDPAALTGEAVGGYIRAHKLYEDAFTSYRRLLREKLGAYRLAHSFAVADAAKLLARRFGAEEERAYLAGLVHDIMKDTPKPEQLAVMQKAGVRLTDAEMHNPKLWHAMAGEAYLRAELGWTDEELLSAVRYHTTGRGRMSLLEKIIYVADFMSADRQYDGVERMRSLAETSLEEAMAFGLSFTIGDLAAKEQVIHPDSVDCYNEIIIEREKGSSL
jgi:nicotinate-nucleotide adenylyltransferase